MGQIKNVEETVQSVRGLLSKHDNLNLTAKTHAQKPTRSYFIDIHKVPAFFWKEIEEKEIGKWKGGMEEKDWEGRMRGKLCWDKQLNKKTSGIVL